MATSEVTTAAAPPFSPRMALYLVEEMNRQLGMIASMAFAAGSYELSKTEPDINTELLFEAIADKAGEAAIFYHLRDMLKSMIPADSEAAEGCLASTRVEEGTT